MTDMPAQDGNSVADDRLQSVQSGADDQQSPAYGTKESEPIVNAGVEAVAIEEIKEPEVPIEVAGWVEKKERGEDIHLAEPVKHRGKTLVEPTNKSQVKAVLPLTEEGVEQGLHVKVIHSLRWLAVWCGRIVKKLPGKVLYKQPRKT